VAEGAGQPTVEQMSATAIASPGPAPWIAARDRGKALARTAAPYDLLLCALLGFIATARLWLVPGYFRADTWLALTAGRDIWTTGIPHTETLTALARGHEWVDQQWLAHLATYGLYRLGGFGVIGALSVVLAAGAFAATTLAARLWGGRARSVLLLMPITAFPFFAQAWQPRTQMFAYPLFAAVFLLLLRDARQPSRRVLLVFPLLALWANLHGSVVLGAALVSLRGCVLAWERRGTLGRRGMWRMPAALVTVPPLLLLLTPYGAGTAAYYRDTLLDGSFKQLATEWQPVFNDPLLLLPFLVLAPLTAWTAVARRRETSLWERVALVLLLASAATALRNMVWLTLGAMPILAVAVNGRVPADPPSSAFAARANRWLAGIAACAVVIAMAVTLARPVTAFERAYPQTYLHAVQQAAAGDPGARIVADLGSADWLLWRDPSLRGRIAFDARLELLPGSRMSDVTSLFRGRPERSSLPGGAYRIFALDRRIAAATIRRLTTQAGGRVVFATGHRVVIRLPRRPAVG
jgi:hypothetical protein